MVHRKLKPQEADLDEEEGEKKSKVGGGSPESTKLTSSSSVTDIHVVYSALLYLGDDMFF